MGYPLKKIMTSRFRDMYFFVGRAVPSKSVIESMFDSTLGLDILPFIMRSIYGDCKQRRKTIAKPFGFLIPDSN